jgi:hypothetical protein
MIAAETPDSSMMPFFDSVAPTQRMSRSIARIVRPPMIIPPAAALSAMVSVIARGTRLGTSVDGDMPSRWGAGALA